ncbi:MAG: hypothetical protein CYPHOPRED_003016 [Cyphobasidiales sp. Tagirdzhanova-0007]|nr:MAG: hypothetical protein CYPHOPRED_003016 [Cyphobasidiales sp. Tagirdzhanova-0007]
MPSIDKEHALDRYTLFTVASALVMTAVAGSPADFPVHAGNVVQLLFSEPYYKDSPWIKYAPPSNAGHAIETPLPPQKAAFVDAGTGAQISHGRLRTDVLRIAAGLRNKLKLSPAPFFPGTVRQPIISPIVMLHLPNSIVYPVLELGIWAAGLTVTTVHFAYTATELAHAIRESKPAVIVTHTGASGLGVLRNALDQIDDKAIVDRLRGGHIFTFDSSIDDYGLNRRSEASQPHSTSTRDWKWLLEADTKDFVIDPYNNEQESKRRCAIILWSSGTTGKGKGVIISHQYLNYQTQMLWYGNHFLTADEVFIGLPPFFHIFGLSNVLLISVATGGTTVCLSKFDPVTYLKVVQTYKATHLHISPPLAVLLAKSPIVDQFNLSSVKDAISGGAPLGSSIMEEVYKRLGFFVRMSYGSSEAGSITQTTLGSWHEVRLTLSATGRPYVGVEMKIVSSDDPGRTVDHDEPGEVLLRSPSVLNGYLNNSTATAEAFSDEGWLRTGDIGFLDVNENLFIVDRLKEMIKVKGFPVAPAELEDLINGHPDVADAGVSSTYNEDEATEYPVAYVVPKSTEILKSIPGTGQISKSMVELVSALNTFIETQTVEYKCPTLLYVPIKHVSALAASRVRFHVDFFQWTDLSASLLGGPVVGTVGKTVLPTFLPVGGGRRVEDVATEWIDEIARTVARVGSKYGIMGFHKVQQLRGKEKAIVEEEGSNALRQGLHGIHAGVRGKISETVSGVSIRNVMDGVAAYVVVKALLPLRLALSVAATPWFAMRILSPSINAIRRGK